MGRVSREYTDFNDFIQHATDEDAIEWMKKNPRNLFFTEMYASENKARQGGKRKTYDTHGFEAELFENLSRLCDALWNYEYHPSRGTAHIITHPVLREIFAAPYPDRTVHHYVIDNIAPWWDPRLCYDSYSCRVGKGTSFGIQRMRHHIQAVSENYSRPCYVIKMDITGYFMHINRRLLFERMLWGLNQQFEGNMGKRYEILRYALHEIIFDDPVRGVKIQGSYEDWRNLPEDKSLFAQPPGFGMVIGNLTSQFMSNVYLDPLDRYVTYNLGYKHYGRYVDDFYIVVTEEQLPQAKRDIKAIAEFLQGLSLTLNEKKTKIYPAGQGVPFLGMVVKNGVILPGKRVMKNFDSAAELLTATGEGIDSITSYMGLLKHYNAGKAICDLFEKNGWDYRF